MAPDQKPSRAPGYLVSPLDDELLLYRPDATQAMYVNATASVIWGLCDGSHTVAEITALLREAYPAAASSIPADVEATLAEFSRHGALRSS